jgi:riboflavin synthase
VFTGLIEMLGTVAEVGRPPGKLRLGIYSGWEDRELKIGESIAVDGCCLTVVEASGRRFFADVAEESLRRTTLGNLALNDRVHLERAMQLGDRLGGHIVQGHVDGTAELIERRADGDALWLVFSLSKEHARFIVEKGSITLAGVSLTVAACEPGRVSVMIIPHTQTQTNFGALRVGARVNLELDILAKHLERLAAPYLGARS